MNEKLMFDMIRKLCNANAVAIDRIARETNINQNLVAKMFIETFTIILNSMEQEGE